MASTTARQSPTPTLLGIPREIRDKIFSYVFLDAYICLNIDNSDESTVEEDDSEHNEQEKDHQGKDKVNASSNNDQEKNKPIKAYDSIADYFNQMYIKSRQQYLANKRPLKIVVSADDLLQVSRQFYTEARPLFRKLVKVRCTFDVSGDYRLEGLMKDILRDGGSIHLKDPEIEDIGPAPSIVTYRSGTISIHPDEEEELQVDSFWKEDLQTLFDEREAGRGYEITADTALLDFQFALTKLFSAFENKPSVDLCRRSRVVGADWNGEPVEYFLIASHQTFQLRIELTYCRRPSGVGAMRRDGLCSASLAS